jgi:TolB-like protein
MGSLIPGYNYDIFISYRQKDNKYDGWVTEFVDNLKKELEATFKEDVNVYFDINPHDGLLETHDVDASLKEKLKCLVFIPIISQTYCDSKSFAWQHEFCAFNKLAKEDRFGRDIRLTGGNVANRILPVKIHDLDPEDQRLYEDVIGGKIRCMEFIYKQPGVNRPLRPDDNKKDNLNKTVYRDQINKVANAVKEILYALRIFRSDINSEKTTIGNTSGAKTESIENNDIARKSIIVLPFANMSPYPQDEYFSDGLTEEIIANLASLQSLRVISRSTSMVLKGTLKDIISIGQELNVEYVLEGSVRKSENKIRITAQLINALNDEHLWAERFDGTMDDIFDVQEKIAGKIVDALKIKLTPVEKRSLAVRQISNPKAYDLWILAKNEFQKLSKEGIERGIFLVKKAIEIEGDNAQLYATLGYMYWGAYDMGVIHETGIFDLMEEYSTKSLALNPDQADALHVKGLILYKKGNLPGYFKYARHAAKKGGDAQTTISFGLAEMGKFDEAETFVEKALSDDPLVYLPWWARACIDMFNGKHEKAYLLLREKRDIMVPGEPFVGWWVAQMAAYAGKKEAAYEEYRKVASSESLPWKDFCKLFQLAFESDRKAVIDLIKTSMIADIARTDEYYPLFISNALSQVCEYDEALVWLKRSVDWGFSNYKFLAEYNLFCEPMKKDPRFIAIVDQARKQHEAFLNDDVNT